MAAGMAIMGFGGGAMIGSPSAEYLMNHFSIPMLVFRIQFHNDFKNNSLIKLGLENNIIMTGIVPEEDLIKYYYTYSNFS